MCHSMKTSFDEKLTYIHLLEAHRRAAKNKMCKRDVLKFEVDLETNLINLYRKIKNGSYRLGKYSQFKIYEPKERIIKSLPYVDRVVHQWYVEEFIKPFYYPRFIKDTFACIENRGSHLAVETLQKYMRIMKRNVENYYILKCDIKKYFYNIDQNILYHLLEKRMRDPKLLEFTKTMVFDGSGPIGIPIGNYTSQYFANIYLNELDHYVKENLHIRFYVRYMDDFILLLKTKEEAKEIKKLLENFVNEKLHLEFNHKSRYYPSAMGVNFCGYRIFETHRLLRTESKKKIRRKIKKWNLQYSSGNYDFSKIEASWNSWLGHASHANTFLLQKRMYDRILMKNFLKNPEFIDVNNKTQINSFESSLY